MRLDGIECLDKASMVLTFVEKIDKENTNRYLYANIESVIYLEDGGIHFSGEEYQYIFDGKTITKAHTIKVHKKFKNTFTAKKGAIQHFILTVKQCFHRMMKVFSVFLLYVVRSALSQERTHFISMKMEKR